MTSSWKWQFAFGVTFLVFLLLDWGNEVFDLPHLLLGAPSTPINWRESLIETIFLIILGVVSYRIIVNYEKKLLDSLNELQRIAAIDALTGILNRREFIERAIVELSRSIRTGAPLIMILIDFDDFKEVNDRYGHLCGDKVLTGFAAAVKRQVRQHDLVGRLGGDEFAIVLTGASWEDAVATMHRIQNEWSKAEVFSDERQKIETSVSMGGTIWNEKDTVIEDVIRRADKLLYQAKNMGGNRIEAG